MARKEGRKGELKMEGYRKRGEGIRDEERIGEDNRRGGMEEQRRWLEKRGERERRKGWLRKDGERSRGEKRKREERIKGKGKWRREGGG